MDILVSRLSCVELFSCRYSRKKTDYVIFSKKIKTRLQSNFLFVGLCHICYWVILCAYIFEDVHDNDIMPIFNTISGYLLTVLV